MTTVTAVRRALEEAATEIKVGSLVRRALRTIADRPQAITILANRLSDRGEAGNAAARGNLEVLHRLLEASEVLEPWKAYRSALEWAIDQLTPPERV